jgi:outer membrane protein
MPFTNSIIRSFIHSVVVTLMICTMSKPASAQHFLTLKEAIQIGLKNNYEINIARRNEEIARRNYHVGNAGLLPVVGLNTLERSRSIFDVEQIFLNGETNIRNNATQDAINYNIALTYPLFAGTGRFQTFYKLREQRDVGIFQRESTVQDVVAAIWIAYFQVLLEKRLLGVLQASLGYSQERLKIARAKYELGRTSKLDFLAAQTDYIADTTALIRQWENLYTSKVDLNVLLSRDAEVQYDVSDTIVVNENLKLDPLLESLYRRNPELKVFEAERRVAVYERREFSAQHFPLVQGFLIYLFDRQETEASFVPFNEISGFNFGFTVEWPIFQGFTLNIDEKNARTRIRIAELELRRRELLLETQMHKTFVEYRNNLVIVELERQNVEIALENVDIVLERYRLGRSDFVQLREVQLNAVRAAARLIEALFLAKQAEIDLLRQSGLIIPMVENMQ